MTAMVLAPPEAATAAWLDAVRRVRLGSGLSVDLPFECRDDDGSWTHVCRVRDGRPVDWTPVDVVRPCIGHDRGVMDEALAGRAGSSDPRWRLRRGRPGGDRPLPPFDLPGIEVDTSSLRLPPDLELAWLTVCLVPGGSDVAYLSELRSGRIRHRIAAPDEPRPATVLTHPLVEHLVLRAGGEVMPAFDDGGVDGDLDEMLFLAGLIGSPPWRAALGLPDAVVWRVHDHIRVFGAMCAQEGSR